MSQPFANKLKRHWNDKKLHHWEDLIDVSHMFPDLPSRSYLFVESLSNLLRPLFLQTFQICCTFRNSFVAIDQTEEDPLPSTPRTVRFRYGRGGRAFLDRRDNTRRVFSKQLPRSSLTCYDAAYRLRPHPSCHGPYTLCYWPRRAATGHCALSVGCSINEHAQGCSRCHTTLPTFLRR